MWGLCGGCVSCGVGYWLTGWPGYCVKCCRVVNRWWGMEVLSAQKLASSLSLSHIISVSASVPLSLFRSVSICLFLSSVSLFSLLSLSLSLSLMLVMCSKLYSGTHTTQHYMQSYLISLYIFEINILSQFIILCTVFRQA